MTTREADGRISDARRLRSGRHIALVVDVDAATTLVRQCGREREDADDPTQYALADRDAAADDLDVVA